VDAPVTGRISGESEAGLTVREGCESRGETWAVILGASVSSRGAKRSWEKVTGCGDDGVADALPRKTVMLPLPPVNCSSSR
jgi:hypothetical protein